MFYMWATADFSTVWFGWIADYINLDLIAIFIAKSARSTFCKSVFGFFFLPRNRQIICNFLIYYLFYLVQLLTTNLFWVRKVKARALGSNVTAALGNMAAQ